MTDVRLRILPPWSTYVKKLEALYNSVVYCTDVERKLGKSFDEWIR